MPAMPRHALPENTPVKFDMRLQDVPGLLAEAYPNTEWRVVRAASQTAALDSHNFILSGTSDDEGNIKLQASQEKILHEAYNQTPSRLWLVARSQARELALAVEKQDWSSTEKFYHGLNALGYTDDHITTNEVDVEDFFAPIARKELGTTSGASLLKKIKKDA